MYTFSKEWLIVPILLIFTACMAQPSDKIEQLLQSKSKEDLIEGALLAGKSKNIKYVPLLLRNADDYRTSISYRFLGFSVYQQKMFALEAIFGKEAPVPITAKPDSVVIKFYTKLASQK